MTKRIFRSMLLAAGAALLACLLIVMGSLYDYYRAVQERQLRDELSLAACGVEQGGIGYLDRLTGVNRAPTAADYRLTWIAVDGTVLFDTHAPASGMENHGSRAEVREALQNGESRGVRDSATLTGRTLYYAKALADGSVLRISISQATPLLLVMGMLQPFLVTVVLVMLLSALLASRMSKSIVEPLAALNLDEPLENDTYEELAPLLRRIYQQHRQIDGQLRELEQKNREFAQITGNMNEGLLLLDHNGAVLSANPAARRIFGEEASRVGGTFPTPERRREAGSAVRRDGHDELRFARDGREYQFNVSRIETAGGLVGTVLLAFDVTERAAAERSRREFTANVSHELKTPLQSIMGSAELLENGMVKEEERQRFCGMIRAEAARLVALVEDIIHLSQLDEGAAPADEPVPLLALANDVADALRERAARRNVTLSVTGEEAALYGARGLLYELLYNLCDNAIRYNKEGGRVEIAVNRAGTDAIEVAVKDTGIGIPPECRERVFERFFRVDKSRSKASGGTGLGLSIVKHIARYHHAEIRLRSTLGEGTEIRVAFPVRQER